MPHSKQASAWFRLLHASSLFHRSISLNTARFHTKNVYAKLGVHSQQELIDLVEKAEQAASTTLL